MNIKDYAIAKALFDKGGGEVSGAIDINANGTYNVAKYATANVNVVPNLQEKTVTENGVVVADSGYDGLSKVTVDVASSGGGDSATLNALIDRSITEIKSSAESVGNYAFSYCSALTTADFPNVASVGNYAFGYCSALTTANIPNATSIMASVFHSCTALTTIDLSNATSIGSYAFTGCSALTSADFPNATSIEGSAFSSCKALTTVDFPNATSLGYHAFQRCYALTTAIIGTNQTSVATLKNTEVFSYCYHILGTTDSTYNPTGAKDGYIYVPLSLVADYRVATNWAEYASQIMPYVNTVADLASIDGTAYDKAYVGENSTEYTYNGTAWEVYTR